MKYLLSISIGPVQDFIATARRSRDLWFGSWLLSELSKAVASAIGKDNLIFPYVEAESDLEPNSDFNVVNKILALVDDPTAIGEAARTKMLSRLSEIRDATFHEISRKGSNGYFLEDVAIKQVEDMVEFLWAAWPLEDASGYAESRERAELLLNARKATRNFDQVRSRTEGGWSSNAPKSALDGQRESAIRDDAFDELSARQLRRTFGIRAGERLCGVGLLKRNGNRGSDDSFFSTSHVAALPLIARLKDKQAVKDYARALSEGLNVNDRELGRVPFKPPYVPGDIFSRNVDGTRIAYDGHILFAERLDDLIEDKSDKRKAKADLDSARSALSSFLEMAADAEKPIPYYALLLADGDNMGKAIDTIEEMARHRELSRELATFAKAVSKIVVTDHNGSLVYAGGDDVLAFLPLHTVLQCARQLSEAFAEKLKSFAFEESGKRYQPTLSVGIVIAHHMEPLQDALTLVREAERAAKSVEGKDALAIILSKRSGSDRTIRGRWQRKGSRNALDHRLLRFAQLHLAGAIPDGAAYELRDLHLRLNVDRARAEYKGLQEAMRKEAVRILARKQIEDASVLTELKSDIESEDTPIDELANELIVAREFANAFKQSGKEPGELESEIAKAAGREPT